jgi:hypothetical protein
MNQGVDCGSEAAGGQLLLRCPTSAGSAQCGIVVCENAEVIVPQLSLSLSFSLSLSLSFVLSFSLTVSVFLSVSLSLSLSLSLSRARALYYMYVYTYTDIYICTNIFLQTAEVIVR